MGSILQGKIGIFFSLGPLEVHDEAFFHTHGFVMQLLLFINSLIDIHSLSTNVSFTLRLCAVCTMPYLNFLV